LVAVPDEPRAAPFAGAVERAVDCCLPLVAMFIG